MINEQLLKYIRSQRDAGTDDQTIRDNLESAGWRSEDVTEGFETLDGGSDQSVKSGNNSPQAHKKIRRDAANRRTQTQGGSSDQATNKQPADTTSEQQQNSQDQYREPVSDGDSPSGKDSAVATPGGSASSGNQQNTPQVSRQERSDQARKPSGTKDSPNVKQQTSPNTAGGVSDSGAQRQSSQADQSASQPGTQRSPDANSGDTGSGAKTSRKATSTDPLSLRTMEEDSKRLGVEPDKPKRPSTKPQKSQNRQTQNSKDDFEQNQSKVKRRSQPAQNQKPNSSQTANARRKFSADPKNPEAVRKRAQKARQQKSSRSNMTSIALFALALLLLAGGGAFAYFSYFQGSSTAEATASEVVQALSDAGTFEYRATIEMVNNNGSPTSYVIEGAVDLHEQTPQETYYTITQSAGSNPPVRAISSETSMYPELDGRKQQEISNLLSNPSFLTIGEFQTQEQLARTNNNSGFSANRFRASFQPSALVSAYAELHQVIFDNQLDNQLRSQLDSSVAGFSPDQGQIWLDPETNYPYQITMIGSNNQGQRSQVTIQFKNYGQNLSETPPYEERSLQSSLAQLWGLSVTTSDVDTSETSTSTADADTGQGQSETTSNSGDSTRRIAERRDQLRINDILQLTVALRLYQRENGQFPTSLSQLASGQSAILTTVPRDPNTDTLYSYAVSANRDSYHLGTTLETTTRAQTFNDANFNSSAQGFTNGFNGTGESCGAVQSMAVTCYDVTGQVD